MLRYPEEEEDMSSLLNNGLIDQVQNETLHTELK